MKHCRVIKPHKSLFIDPLIVRKGNVLRPGKRAEEYPRWVWCINGDGKGGWVPERYIDLEGKYARMNRDYNAFELNVREGEILTILDEESGWLLCEKKSGMRGWIPKDNAAYLDD